MFVSGLLYTWNLYRGSLIAEQNIYEQYIWERAGADKNPRYIIQE